MKPNLFKIRSPFGLAVLFGSLIITFYLVSMIAAKLSVEKRLAQAGSKNYSLSFGWNFEVQTEPGLEFNLGFFKVKSDKMGYSFPWWRAIYLAFFSDKYSLGQTNLYNTRITMNRSVPVGWEQHLDVDLMQQLHQGRTISIEKLEIQSDAVEAEQINIPLGENQLNIAKFSANHKFQNWTYTGVVNPNTSFYLHLKRSGKYELKIEDPDFYIHSSSPVGSDVHLTNWKVNEKVFKKLAEKLGAESLSLEGSSKIATARDTKKTYFITRYRGHFKKEGNAYAIGSLPQGEEDIVNPRWGYMLNFEDDLSSRMYFYRMMGEQFSISSLQLPSYKPDGDIPISGNSRPTYQALPFFALLAAKVQIAHHGLYEQAFNPLGYRQVRGTDVQDIPHDPTLFPFDAIIRLGREERDDLVLGYNSQNESVEQISFAKFPYNFVFDPGAKRVLCGDTWGVFTQEGCEPISTSLSFEIKKLHERGKLRLQHTRTVAKPRIIISQAYNILRKSWPDGGDTYLYREIFPRPEVLALNMSTQSILYAVNNTDSKKRQSFRLYSYDPDTGETRKVSSMPSVHLLSLAWSPSSQRFVAILVGRDQKFLAEVSASGESIRPVARLPKDWMFSQLVTLGRYVYLVRSEDGRQLQKINEDMSLGESRTFKFQSR